MAIENNTPCECVFVCVESVLVPEDNVCMCVCANQDEHCGLSQPVIYMLLSNELTVQKKKIFKRDAISMPWHRRSSGKSKHRHKSY